MSAQELYEHYKNMGFRFPDEILTRYTLSLATKPFVILSGISGTGKTKIAQLFEPPFSTGSSTSSTGAVQTAGYILVSMTKGMTTEGDGRGNFTFEQLSDFLDSNEVNALNAKIAAALKKGDDRNICDPIPLTIESADGNDKLDAAVYLQRPSSPLARIRLKSKRGDAKQYDSRSYFEKNFSIGDVIRLKKVGDKHLKIVDVNNSAAETQQQEAENLELTKIDNKCFISVKSNWTDSSELFGYYNPLNQKYVMTKLLRFLLKAAENPDVPFFVILDEMNLSKVEHYFSDFLSCIESRSVDGNGKITQEAIQVYAASDFVLTDDDYYDEICSSVEIPTNLYVTGTVNVDDTTYMFSPKVLDRANVIEFNDVHLPGDPLPGGLKLSQIPNFGIFTKSAIDMYDTLGQESKDLIQKLINLLRKYNLHFGYRTIAEISHFVKNAKDHVANNLDTELAALDIQILQKVLPKLYGNFAKLHLPLKELIHLLSDSNSDLENFEISEIEAIAADLSSKKFPRSLEKLIKMYKTLSTQGFATFIE